MPFDSPTRRDVSQLVLPERKPFTHTDTDALVMAIAVGEQAMPWSALVAANAIGDVFTVEGESLTGGDAEPGPPALLPESFTNTTLMLVVTDARLTRSELSRLVVRAHDALAVCMRPAHTRLDGDIVFAVWCHRGGSRKRGSFGRELRLRLAQWWFGDKHHL